MKYTDGAVCAVCDVLQVGYMPCVTQKNVGFGV